MVQPDPELQYPRVVNDDCCMSGLATVKLRSELEDQHIIYISYENEVDITSINIRCQDKFQNFRVYYKLVKCAECHTVSTCVMVPLLLKAREHIPAIMHKYIMSLS